MLRMRSLFTAVALVVTAVALFPPSVAAEIRTVSRVCVSGDEFNAASMATTRRQVERIWGQHGTVDPHYQLLTPEGEYVTVDTVILVNYRQCTRPWKRLGVSVYYEKRPRGWMVLAKMYRGTP